MRVWIVVVLIVIVAIVVLVATCQFAKTRLELRRLRRIARDQNLTLLRINSLTGQICSARVSQGLELQRNATQTAMLEVTPSPSGPWPSVATL